MRRLLRRLAWLFARLLLVVVLSFLVLAKATERGSFGGTDFATDRIEESELPLLLNPQPRDLELRVREIVQRLSRGDTAHDIRELHRLGGACFPLVMPMLAKLPEASRCRIAAALLPVAKRMAWRDADEQNPNVCAASYLIDAWKERVVDFQPPIVARWVERFANRGGNALTASVVEYDTYALPALMGLLPDVDSDADIARARQLVSVARRITGLDWSIPTHANAAEARNVVDHWRRWWQLHAVEYTVVQGPSRWSAMLKQTQFGQWLTLAAKFRFGMTRDQQAISNALSAAVVRSLLLLAAATIGAVIAAAAKSRWLTLQQSTHLRVWPTRFLASIPDVSLIACLSQLGFEDATVTACGVAAIAMGLLVLGNDSEIVEPTQHGPLDPTSKVAQAMAIRVRRQLPYWLFAGHTWPFLLTLVFVVEKAFHVHGIGAICVSAFRRRDLHMLMAVTTTTALWLLLVEFSVQFGRILSGPHPTQEPSP